MSSARTEGTDHFCMSLKELPPLLDACLDATVVMLPAQAFSREDCAQQPDLSPLGEPAGPGLLAPILEVAMTDAFGSPSAALLPPHCLSPLKGGQSLSALGVVSRRATVICMALKASGRYHFLPSPGRQPWLSAPCVASEVREVRGDSCCSMRASLASSVLGL